MQLATLGASRQTPARELEDVVSGHRVPSVPPRPREWQEEWCGRRAGASCPREPLLGGSGPSGRGAATRSRAGMEGSEGGSPDPAGGERADRIWNLRETWSEVAPCARVRGARRGPALWRISGHRPTPVPACVSVGIRVCLCVSALPARRLLSTCAPVFPCSYILCSCVLATFLAMSVCVCVRYTPLVLLCHVFLHVFVCVLVSVSQRRCLRLCMRPGPCSVPGRFFSISVSPSYLCVSVCAPHLPELLNCSVSPRGFCVCGFVFCVFLGAFVCLYREHANVHVEFSSPTLRPLVFTQCEKSKALSLRLGRGLGLDRLLWVSGPQRVAAGRRREGKAGCAESGGAEPRAEAAGRPGALCPLLATVCPCNHCWVPKPWFQARTFAISFRLNVSSLSQALKTHLGL